MKKSIYSLMLTDSVVAAADSMAYAKGVSRSALIDELLAQSLSCVTTEMRMRDIFVSLETLMQNNQVFKVQTRGSDSMLSLFSAIQYKYRPTIRYSVELYRQPEGAAFGALKIQSRTQNSRLLYELECFYRLWIETERAFLGDRTVLYSLRDGRLCRELYLLAGRSGYAEAELGEGIGAYIQCFDSAMKAFFDSESDQLRHERVYAALLTYYQKNTFII